MLRAASRVLRVDHEAIDTRYRSDVVLFQVRHQRRETASLPDDDRHRPLGAVVEESGEIGHANRMKKDETAQAALLQFAPNARHPRLEFRLLDAPTHDGRRSNSLLRRCGDHPGPPFSYLGEPAAGMAG